MRTSTSSTAFAALAVFPVLPTFPVFKGSSAAAGCLLVLASAFLKPAPCQAQPSAPSLQPGAIERQWQTPPQPRASLQPIALPAVQQRMPEGAESVRFGVQRIEVEGVSALPAQAVREMVAPLEGREITLAELVVLANRLTATYRNEGFILAQVVVPEQRIEPQAASVRLQAIEGFVDAVRFTGDEAGDTERLNALASAIRAARPLTATALERYLLLLNDIPGLRAATTLTPSPSLAGAADLEIRLSRGAWGAEVSIDNRGSRAVGPWRATVELEAFGLTGPSRTSGKLVSTADRQLRYGQFRHEQLVNSEGTKLTLNISHARSRPALPASLGALSFETASSTFEIGLQHPLKRSRSENLYARASLTGYDGEAITNGTLTSLDRTRALRLGLTWDRADSMQGLNIIDVELARGFAGLGATAADDPNRSRMAARPDFAKATLYAARLQSLAPRWAVLLAAQAQYAATGLPSPELFGLGGEPFGRGYESSELVGDHGAALKLELRFSGNTELSWLPAYTLYAFYDAGAVRRKLPLNEDVQTSLSSAGVGLRFGAASGISGFLEVAQPLTLLVASRGDRNARAHAGIAAKF